LPRQQHHDSGAADETVDEIQQRTRFGWQERGYLGATAALFAK